MSPRSLTLKKSSTRGSSLLEIIVIIATFGALLRLGIPNWYEFRSRASDVQGVKFYRQLKEELLRAAQEENHPAVAVFNQTKTKQLGTLGNLTVPAGILLHYALYLPKSTNLEEDMSVLAFEVSHEKGNVVFRYLRIGDELLEQQIAKES